MHIYKFCAETVTNFLFQFCFRLSRVLAIFCQSFCWHFCEKNVRKLPANIHRNVHKNVCKKIPSKNSQKTFELIFAKRFTQLCSNFRGNLSETIRNTIWCEDFWFSFLYCDACLVLTTLWKESILEQVFFKLHNSLVLMLLLKQHRSATFLVQFHFVTRIRTYIT